ncbi:MAG: hypothetical protein HY071_05290 [Chloroflexi bacterium]|nr:hypothetical protein [Chloroflexota bacterium]
MPLTARDRAIAIALATIACIAYVAAGWDLPTVYDYQGRLADALVHGRWWLVEDPAWLNELLSCGDGRFCVAYPPLPAVLAIPVLFAGTAQSQSLVAQLCGGLSSGVLYLACRVLGAPRAIALSGAVLSAFGTTLLFSSADGRAWFVAHSVAMLFTSLAMLLAARGGPGWGVGAAVGLAALARLPVAAAFPALALLLARRADIPYTRALRGIVLGGASLALVYVAYDLMRWGTIFDSGYTRLAEGDIFFNFGVFSPLYIPRHVVAIFLEPPEIVPGSPTFLRFHTVGMSLFLATPAFLWVFAGLRLVRRDPAILALALASALALLPDVLHGTVGFAQFGYRFSIDAQPFLVGLAISGDAKRGGPWRRWPSIGFTGAIVAGVIINIYATIAIMRLGLWE